MNVKYDSTAINRLVDATENHVAVIQREYLRLRQIFSILDKQWDDSKKREFDSIVNELDTNIKGFSDDFLDYIKYLKVKITELENR